jgi:hypothetical protein
MNESIFKKIAREYSTPVEKPKFSEEDYKMLEKDLLTKEQRRQLKAFDEKVRRSDQRFRELCICIGEEIENH